MKTFTEFKISRLEELLQELRHKRTAIYGTGSNAERVVELSADDLIIVDDQKADIFWKGHYVYSLNEAVCMGIQALILAAQTDSAFHIFERIGTLAVTGKIAVYDVYGNDFSELYRKLLFRRQEMLCIDENAVRKKISEHDELSVSFLDTLCIQTEEDPSVLVPRDQIVQLIKKAIDEGKPVHVILNGGVSKKAAMDFWKQNDMAEQNCRFISLNSDNEYFKGLFYSVREQCEGSVLHIGTAELADGLAPETLGVDCIVLPTCERLMRSSLYAGIEQYASDTEEQNAIREMTFRAFANPFILNHIQKHFVQKESYGPAEGLLKKMLGEQKYGLIDGSRSNVLVLDAGVPVLNRDTGSKVSYHYLKLFRKLGMEVYFLPADTKDDAVFSHQLESENIHLLTGSFYCSNWIHWLAENGDKLSCVFIQRPQVADKYLDAIMYYCGNARIIYHPADIHFLRLKRQLELEGGDQVRRQYETYHKLECDIFDKVERIYVVGSYEKAMLDEMYPEKTVRNIPIFAYEEEKIADYPPASARKDLLFVGGFSHAPNIDAVNWLATEIMTKVHQMNPEIKCHIVGSNMPGYFEDYANEYMIMDGFVSDERLEELYRQCRLTIVPLRFGAGVKGKIIESAYYHVPVITTTVGAEGIPDIEKFLLVKDLAEDFAKSIVDLYDNAEKIDEMSAGAEEVIRKHYTVEVAERILREDLEGIL